MRLTVARVKPTRAAIALCLMPSRASANTSCPLAIGVGRGIVRTIRKTFEKICKYWFKVVTVWRLVWGNDHLYCGFGARRSHLTLHWMSAQGSVGFRSGTITGPYHANFSQVETQKFDPHWFYCLQWGCNNHFCQECIYIYMREGNSSMALSSTKTKVSKIWNESLFKIRAIDDKIHIKKEVNDYLLMPNTLQWRHNDGVTDHLPHDCLLNRLFRRKSKKTSKLRVTGLRAGTSPETGEFPAQMASHAENISIWWRHHVLLIYVYMNATSALWLFEILLPWKELLFCTFCVKFYVTFVTLIMWQLHSLIHHNGGQLDKHSFPWWPSQISHSFICMTIMPVIIAVLYMWCLYPM